MVQVPELFTQYISSFSGCMGGNPNAPIWLVVDHSARCPLPIDPEKVFANPVTNIDALKRALPTTCPCTESVTRSLQAILKQKLLLFSNPKDRKTNSRFFC